MHCTVYCCCLYLDTDWLCASAFISTLDPSLNPGFDCRCGNLFCGTPPGTRTSTTARTITKRRRPQRSGKRTLSSWPTKSREYNGLPRMWPFHPNTGTWRQWNSFVCFFYYNLGEKKILSRADAWTITFFLFRIFLPFLSVVFVLFKQKIKINNSVQTPASFQENLSNYLFYPKKRPPSLWIGYISVPKKEKF